jgi:voltage-gated potassium channel
VSVSTVATDDTAGHDLTLGSLSRQRRIRIVAGAILRTFAMTVVVVAAYFLLPFDHGFAGESVIGLVFGLVAVVALIGWEIWRITSSDYPTLRGVEALGLIVPLYILLFAVAYFLMERANPASFGSPLSKIDAMYYSATVFTTVGFGDITAKTQVARVVVTIQMMLDLVFVGLVVRLGINAVKVGQRRHQPTD